MTQDRSTRRAKRRQPETSYEADEVVDDLAYAATFAMMGPPDSEFSTEENDAIESSAANTNDEEIELEDEEEAIVEGDSKEESSAAQEMPETKEEEEEDDDDDDDLDLNIAAMEDETDEMKDPAGEANAAPKTQNEVDAYNTPIQELEQHLHFRLSVDENKDGPSKSRKFDSSNLICAGKVKHYMIHDRTVVVESNPPVNGNPLSPLDEGSFLVLKDTASNNNSNNSLIPLGKIFEVFGPVTRPLYTIRLAAPPSTNASTKSAPTKTDPQGESKASDDQDIAQNDTEGGASNSSPQHKTETMDKATRKNADIATTAPSPAISNIDHWAPDGKYSLLLGASDAVSVFFVQDEAKLLDTGTILRNSGKGCGTLISIGYCFCYYYFLANETTSLALADASNLYDEEVGNGDVMYYSDDEKERQAKGRRKQSGRGQAPQRRNQNQGGRGGGPVPAGFHHAPPSGFHNAPPPPPQGFHNPAVQQRQTQAQPAYPYPQSASAKNQMPPPGRGGSDQPPAYQY